MRPPDLHAEIRRVFSQSTGSSAPSPPSSVSTSAPARGPSRSVAFQPGVRRAGGSGGQAALVRQRLSRDPRDRRRVAAPLVDAEGVVRVADTRVTLDTIVGDFD